MAGWVEKYVLNDSPRLHSQAIVSNQMDEGILFLTRGGNFLLDTKSKSAPRPTEPPIQ